VNAATVCWLLVLGALIVGLAGCADAPSRRDWSMMQQVIGIGPALERCGMRGDDPSPVGMAVPHLACRGPF